MIAPHLHKSGFSSQQKSSRRNKILVADFADERDATSEIRAVLAVKRLVVPFESSDQVSLSQWGHRPRSRHGSESGSMFQDLQSTIFGVDRFSVVKREVRPAQAQAQLVRGVTQTTLLHALIDNAVPA